MSAEAPPTVNSKEYWEHRFSTDWDALGGPDQTHYFGRLFGEILPLPIRFWISEHVRSVLDWGCGTGEASALLQTFFPYASVTGLDFSPTAISRAAAKYPEVRFTSASLDELGEYYDVIFVSNTLEHFDEPWKVAGNLATRARRLLIALVPFREVSRLAEHAVTFTPASVPLAVGGLDLIHYSVHTANPRFWPGRQLLLVYASEEVWDAEARAQAREQSIIQNLTVEDCRDLLEGPSLEPPATDVRLSVAGFLFELSSSAPEEPEDGIPPTAPPVVGTLPRLLGYLGERQRETAAALDRATAEATRSAESLDRLRRIGRRLAARARALAAKERQQRLELSDRDQALTRLEARSTDLLEHTKAALEAELARATRRVSDLDAALQAETSRASSLESSLAQRDVELAETSRRIAEREAALASANAQLVAALNATTLRVARNVAEFLRAIATGKLSTAIAVVRRSVRGLLRRPGREEGRAAPQPAKGEAWPPRRSVTKEPAAAPGPLSAAPVRVDTAFDIVCFPIIEWDFRWQRPQQLLTRLGTNGHRVFYVSQRFRTEGPAYALRSVGDNVYEVSLRGSPANVYQDQLTPDAAEQLFAALDAVRRDLALGATVSLLQLPFWWPVAEKAWQRYAWPIVYDCMDDHAGFSTNRPQMLKQEEALIRGARLVSVSSERLRERIVELNPSCLLVPNACDFAHFSKVGPAPRGARPVIGYYGAIADWFDADLVADLAERRQDWDFVLVGSTFTADTSRLTRLPNVSLPGEQPYADLPGWIDRFDVLMIPFKRTPLTEATNPVKAYEILASGRPLVSVPLPEMLALQPHVRLASTVADFEREILAALAEDSAEQTEARRAFARCNTWEERADRLKPALRDAFPLASVVIVTYNNLALNRRCIESVYGRTEWPNFEVVVVDNASEDGTPAYLAEAQRDFPTLHVVLNDRNEGFAAANNAGLARAAGEFLVLLNNDTVVPRGWLAALIRHLHRDRTLGMAGPVSNAVGNEAQIEVGYQDVADMPAWAAGYVRDHDDESFDVSMLAMFCVAMRREVFDKVGPLDERFEVGMFEDDDYARRVRRAGYRIACVRDSFVHHWQKASFRLLGEPEYLKLYHRNRRRFDEKWGEKPGPRAVVASPAGLEELYGAAEAARGVVVFPPSVGWGIHLFQRPHHLARALTRLGYVVAFDCSNAYDDVTRLRELKPRLFLYRGAPEDFHHLREPIVWTFPYNFHFAEAFPYGARTVYDWIDDLSVFTAWDKDLVRRNHARAMEKATVVATVARPLYEEALRTRPDALYLPNAVDYEHFANLPERVPDPKLARLSKGQPVAGYYGALAPWFDDEMLDETAARRPDWSFLLVGPMYEGGLRGARSLKRPNVIWTGPRDYRGLPGYAAWFDVALIPFQLNAITRATSPLKLYEYFAAGRPVISTALPECESFPEVRIVHTASELSEALDVALADARNPQFVERLRAIGRQNSWRARVEAVLACWGGGAAAAMPTACPPATGAHETRPRRGHEEGAGWAPLATSGGATAVLLTAQSPYPTASGRSVLRAITPKTHAGRRLAERFSAHLRPDNSLFHAALSDHFASIEADPALPMHFEYAITANDRGRSVADLIAARRPLRGARVLDVGCAYGGVVVAFTQRGCSATGIDISESWLQLGRVNLAEQGVTAPLLNRDAAAAAPDFESGFDIIVANDVIEHVANLDGFLDNLALWLRPDGCAYLEIPNGKAVEAVLSDGHHALFGITLLEHQQADAYLRAARGSDYDTYNYRRLEDYLGQFRARGLGADVLRRSWEGTALEDVRAALEKLTSTAETSIAGVPEPLRPLVRARVNEYVREVRSCIGLIPSREVMLRYGSSFWTVELTKQTSM